MDDTTLLKAGFFYFCSSPYISILSFPFPFSARLFQSKKTFIFNSRQASDSTTILYNPSILPFSCLSILFLFITNFNIFSSNFPIILLNSNLPFGFIGCFLYYLYFLIRKDNSFSIVLSCYEFQLMSPS